MLLKIDSLALKSWPFTEAEKLLKKFKNIPPKKGYILFETGYGPSGLPHIGTFGEIARTMMVVRAFNQISDIPTKLICFSDDLDGLRKVPSNIPNQELIAKYLDQPLTKVPDPFEECNSFGEYMNNKMKSFLERFNFDCEFYSATEFYQSGKFDHMLIKVLRNYDKIMDIMLPTLREERQATYSPFLPICQATGKVLQVPVKSIDLKENTITYKDIANPAKDVTVKVTGGNCKLQWKPDFGMRWSALEVDYEMYGKDHMTNSKIYSDICEVLDGEPPVQFFYELFLNEAGAKISKSKGNNISIDDWLKYAPIESISLFMYQSPGKAKRLHFDVIPKNVDEYLTFVSKYHEEESLEKKLDNPVHHIHGGKVPQIQMHGLNFNLLLNLAAACNPENKQVLWGFITKYSPSATPSNAPYLDSLIDYAINYYNDFVKSQKKYLSPTPQHKEILKQIISNLDNLTEDSDTQEIQNKIYEVGMQANYENLREYFSQLYQIILGQVQGPRLGSFIKLYGLNKTKQLIKKILDERE